MPNESDQPVVVNGAVLPTTLAAGLRILVSITLPLLIDRGILPADSAEGVTAIVVTIATVAYGIYKTHQRKALLVDAAAAAPNSKFVVE
jgi:hypothetical protein